MVLAEKLHQIDSPQYIFEDLCELAMRFLSSHWNMRQTGQLNLRRTALRLAFAERITYSRKDGLSNVKTSLHFNILKEICMQKMKWRAKADENENWKLVLPA